jgi:hypothetical protein
LPPRHIYSENKTAFFYDQTHIAGLVERSISFCLMKNHEWKAMGRVIYGSRKTTFFEKKKANFAARLNCTTHHFDAAANWIDGEFSSILALFIT